MMKRVIFSSLFCLMFTSLHSGGYQMVLIDIVCGSVYLVCLFISIYTCKLNYYGTHNARDRIVTITKWIEVTMPHHIMNNI